MSSSSDTLRIHEEFVSLQGEGALAGVPSRFIRVAGCNLRCHWCDSPGTSWAPTGARRSVAELIEGARRGPRHVVVTGGEPMLFAGTERLVAGLRELGKHVTIETAGTVDRPDVGADLWSISPKLAHSEPHSRDPARALAHARARWNPSVVRALVDRAGDASSWQLKFVVRANDSAALDVDVEEVERMLAELGVGHSERARVFLMPEGTDPDRLHDDYRRLTPVVTRRGLALGPRLHIALFGHTPGT